ncbi:MAG: MFS transporter [Bacteroidota bacterium]
MDELVKNRQYYKFCAYGFLKNLRFFDAFFILFLVEKGLTYTQIGILYAVREVITNLLELPSGILADTFGRKKTLVGSFLAYISSFIVFYLFQDFWLFLIAFMLFGIGEAFRSGTHKGMIMDYLKLNDWEKQSANYYGHTRSWSQMGSALSALAAGLIVFYGGSYQIIFLYSIVPYVLNLILILSYPTELNYSFKPSDQKKRPTIGSTARMLTVMLKQPHVLRIIHSSAVHTAYLRAVKDYIQIVMVNLSLVIPLMIHLETKKKSGIVIGVIYFFIFLATSLASRSSSKLAEKSRRNISYLTLLAGFVAGIISGITFMYDIWLISLLAFALIYVAENIRKPVLTGAVADKVPKEILTSVISAQSLLRTIQTTLFAIVFGIMADYYGIGISLMTVSGLFLLSTVLIQRSFAK